MNKVQNYVIFRVFRILRYSLSIILHLINRGFQKWNHKITLENPSSFGFWDIQGIKMVMKNEKRHSVASVKLVRISLRLESTLCLSLPCILIILMTRSSVKKTRMTKSPFWSRILLEWSEKVRFRKSKTNINIDLQCLPLLKEHHYSIHG